MVFYRNLLALCFNCSFLACFVRFSFIWVAFVQLRMIYSISMPVSPQCMSSCRRNECSLACLKQHNLRFFQRQFSPFEVISVIATMWALVNAVSCRCICFVYFFTLSTVVVFCFGYIKVSTYQFLISMLVVELKIVIQQKSFRTNCSFNMRCMICMAGAKYIHRMRGLVVSWYVGATLASFQFLVNF